MEQGFSWPALINDLESVEDHLIVTADAYQSFCKPDGSWLHLYWTRRRTRRLPHIRKEWLRLRVWRVLAWAYRKIG